MSVNLKEIFGRRIKIEPKVRSISGVFFSKESLEQTNYQPSYQRNYVWDDEKATYFIESIFLGTELPPLIYFKSEKDEELHNEIIDGRQRYQTILRFVQGDLRLKKNGLQKLGDVPGFAGNTFDELDDEYKATFEDTKIRIIEYSFLSDHTLEEEEAVKKEVFQRYNSGITPLKSAEIDKAQYLSNDLNEFLKERLKEDTEFDGLFTKLFRLQKNSIEQKVMKMRELLVLHKIPIKYYAIQKQKVIRKYFDLLSEQIEDDQIWDVFGALKRKMLQLDKVERRFSSEGINYNRLISECLLWAFTIVEEEKGEKVEMDMFHLQTLTDYFKEHIDSFSMERSSFVEELTQRYTATADYFEKEFSCNFNLYIENSDKFKRANRQQTVSTVTYSALSFDELRINKPEPTSVEVVEFLRTIKNGRFLIRPPYQRGEVKNRKKSSSIIESLLLGIKLPPIFVFKRKDGISEVIDGQQRLLSIIGFMGEKYLDENGEEQESLMSGFSLDLKDNGILKDLHGSTYDKLSKTEQNKIKTSDIWVIEINGRINKNFDQVDLFIRLNNKPYPIPKDSFEMWNSFASRSLIDTIRQACRHNERWFYFRKNNKRMDNENLFTTLAYFQYAYQKYGMKEMEVAPERSIEIFKMDKRITCRFRFRYEISKLMEQENHEDFIKAINTLEFGFVRSVRSILNDSAITTADLSKALDELLNFDSRKRTQMMFYVLWVLLHDLSHEKLVRNATDVGGQIRSLVALMSNCKDVDTFKMEVLAFRREYEQVVSDVEFHLDDVADILTPDASQKVEVDMLLEPNVGIDGRFPVQSLEGKVVLQKHVLGIKVTRAGIRPRYVECFLRSLMFSAPYLNAKQNLGSLKLQQVSIPYADENTQAVFCNIIRYVDLATGLEKKYFERILDLLVYEQTYKKEFVDANINLLSIVSTFPDLSRCDNNNQRKESLSLVYNEQSDVKSDLSVQLLMSIDLDVFRQHI